jgi:hypothetical protein
MRNLLAPTAIPVLVVRELDYVEVPVKKIVIDGPFVLAFVVDEPNAIQPILSAVIPDPEHVAVNFSETGIPSFVRETHY